MSLLYLSEDVLHQYMLKLHCIGGIGDDLTWLEAINVVVSTCWTCFVHHMRRCKNQIKTTFGFKVLVLFNAKYCELLFYIIYNIYKQESPFVFMKYSKAKTNCKLHHMVYNLDVSIKFLLRWNKRRNTTKIWDNVWKLAWPL